MKVKYQYSGDFTGIIREAVIDLTAKDCGVDAECARVLQVLATNTKDSPLLNPVINDSNARDAGHYHFEFTEDTTRWEASFNRSSLPIALREVLGQINQLTRPNSSSEKSHR